MDITDAKVSNFNIPTLRGFSVTEKILSFLMKYLDKYVKLYPIFDYDVCKSCGICVSNCTPKALKRIEKHTCDLKTCIKCFCCQELCLHKAVNIKKPYIARLFYR